MPGSSFQDILLNGAFQIVGPQKRLVKDPVMVCPVSTE
jgi:hypothetical protein